MSSTLEATAYGVVGIDTKTGQPKTCAINHSNNEKGREKAARVAEKMAADFGEDLEFKDPSGRVTVAASKDALRARKSFGFSDLSDEKWARAFGKKIPTD